MTSADSRGTPVLLRDLTRSFGSVRALAGMTLDIEPGSMLVLLGPSGCGKTTALRILAGLEDADSGEVLVNGRDISTVPTAKRDMGMVFQAYSLFPHLTARENVAFGLRMRGVGGTERGRTAERYLHLVGLSEHADRYAHQLSGGQQQRVALARALAIEPTVLLLDEPLSALDAKVRLQLREEIRRLQLEVGITTLFVTHDQEEALAVADQVGVMRDGRIEQIGTPQQIYNQPVNEFVASFVGLTNRLPAVAAASSVRVFESAVPTLPGSATAGPAVALVRPEMIVLRPGDGASGPTTATVVATSFLGSLARVQLRIADGSIVLAQAPVADVAFLGVGDQVELSVKPTPVLATAA